MKALTIVVLSALAELYLIAADQPVGGAVAWREAAQQAQSLLKEGRIAEAAESGKRSLEIAKRFGPDDPSLAGTHFLLGSIYRQWGHCPEARAGYAHAIAIWKRQPEPPAHHLFNAMNSLISTLSECDDYSAAEKAFRLYESDMLRYRTEPIDDAKIMSTRAVLASGRKNFADAENYIRQTIQLMEKTPEASPTEIALEHSNLAVVINYQKRYVESLAESRRAIEFLENAAPKHPSLVASLNNAACALAALGRGDESERTFERALAAASELYGEENRIVAKIMLSYARVLRENQQSPAAAQWQKRGSEAFRRSLRHDNGMVDVETLRAAAK